MNQTAPFIPKRHLGWAGGQQRVPQGGLSHPLPGAAGSGTPGMWFNQAPPGRGRSGFPRQGRPRLGGFLLCSPQLCTGGRGRAGTSPSAAFLQLRYQQALTDTGSKLRGEKIYQLEEDFAEFMPRCKPNGKEPESPGLVLPRRV